MIKRRLLLLIIIPSTLFLALALMATAVLTTVAYAATPTPNSSSISQQTPPKTLTIVLRDSHGKFLSGVECQVLSYGWGLQISEPYAVIAQGITDQNGVVAFDDTIWPASEYRFRFEPTATISPTDTYFMPDSQNQYYGFPAADIGLDGGPYQTEYFVVSGDGLTYSDLSYGRGIPDYSTDSSMGLNKPGPSITLMSSDNYFATSRAATATAYANGMPIATTPPIPPTFDGTPAAPLSQTPGPDALTAKADSEAIMNQAFASTATANAAFLATVNAQNLTLTPNHNPTAANNAAQNNGGGGNSNSTRPTSQEADGSAGVHQANLGQSFLMAVFGVVCFVLFWRYRYNIYRLLGLSVEVPIRRKARKAKKAKKPTLLARLAVAAQASQNKNNRKDANK